MELFVTLYFLLSQGIMSEKFLMPSLENISKRYGFNSSVAGLLIAIGVSIPELVVTCISFQRHGTKMTEFGLACVFGSVCFATLMIPAVSYLLNFGIKNPRPAETARETKQREDLLPQFLRDMVTIIIGLSMYYHVLEHHTITFSNCMSFFVLAIFYLLVSFGMQYQRGLRDIAEKKQREDEELSAI